MHEVSWALHHCEGIWKRQPGTAHVNSSTGCQNYVGKGLHTKGMILAQERAYMISPYVFRFDPCIVVVTEKGVIVRSLP